MKPAKLDLPTIWRGCDWGLILKWKDLNGDPIDLTTWFPIAQSLNIDLNAHKTNDEVGKTVMLLNKTQTAFLKLGVESWDWIFERTDHSYRFPPLLAGKVAIKEPITKINGTLIGVPDIDTITVELPIFAAS